jgi:hypothetical protein
MAARSGSIAAIDVPGSNVSCRKRTAAALIKREPRRAFLDWVLFAARNTTNGDNAEWIVA